MIEIIPISKKINAEILAPPSKAHTLRAFFIASLAKGESEIINPLLGEDQKIAISALKEFGAEFKIQRNKILIKGTSGKLKIPDKKIYVGNSGVSARFIISYSALMPSGSVIITGSLRMEKRPQNELILALKKLGVRIDCLKKTGFLPLKVFGGNFNGGETSLSGSISSQFFSSILISAPYAKKDVIINSKGLISSKPYIDITISMMKKFGVNVENLNYKTFIVKAPCVYSCKKLKIEGDYTNASYFLAACAILGGRLKVKNLNKKSVQGDKVILKILKNLGLKVKFEKENVVLESSQKIRPIKIDMNLFPDLVPTLAIILVCAKGKSEILNIEHLKYKECNRIKALVSELTKLGFKLKAKKDALIIWGNPDINVKTKEIECYNDHRIAMAFSILGLRFKGIIIKNPECTNKSFPNFYETLKKIGARFKKI